MKIDMERIGEVGAKKKAPFGALITNHNLMKNKNKMT